MFDRDKWQEIFATIRKNKLRTGLTAAGVFWGITMLIFMLGMGNGLENGVLQEFGGRSTNSLYIWPERTSIAHKGLPVGREVEFTIDDMHELRKNVPEIELLAPRCNWRGASVTYKADNNNYDVRGEWESIFAIESMRLQEGRLMNQLDIKEKRKVAFIGQTVKDEIFKEESPIGKYISVNGASFQVVGVVKYDGQSRHLQEADELIFVPLETFQRVFGWGKRISWFVCTVEASTGAGDVEGPIKRRLASRHKISHEDQQAIRSFNLEEEFRQLADLFTGIRIFLWIVGIMTLFAGVVSVSNVMLITVKDRTREIGIRKAIGATPWSIVSMIILESVFITTLSGYLGLLIGVALIALIAQTGVNTEMFSNPEIGLDVSLSSLIVLILSGMIAGLLPALHAARIRPVEALRT